MSRCGPVVELAGLPGSGKTTAAALVHDLIVTDGLRCTVVDRSVSAATPMLSRVGHRGLGCLHALQDDPVRTSRTVLSLLRSGQRSRRDSVALVAQWLTTQQLLVRARQSVGVQLLEEGLHQTMWTGALRGSRLAPDRLWADLPAAARPDLVVHLDLSPSSADDRLAARTSRHSRSQALAPTQRLAELVHGQHLLEEILATGPVPVRRISVTGASVDAVARTVRDAILDL